jgi:hypothetical protein
VEDGSFVLRQSLVIRFSLVSAPSFKNKCICIVPQSREFTTPIIFIPPAHRDIYSSLQECP